MGSFGWTWNKQIHSQIINLLVQLNTNHLQWISQINHIGGVMVNILASSAVDHVGIN
jgi:hypothetical protein